MPFKIIRNDITTVKADAIVNTANPRPVAGAGTDSAIHRAAGPQLLEDRRRIGDLEPGQCAATPAYALPARYVLHTVSPEWNGGSSGEEATLRKAYDAALEQAVKLHCRSVAFPLMAAGTYGFPRDLALSTAISAFTDFLLSHRITIYLVLFDKESFGLASALFDDLRSYIDDNYVLEMKRKEYASGANRRVRPDRGRARLNNKAAVVHQDALYEEAEGEESLKYSAPVGAPSPAATAGSLSDFLKYSESTFSEYLLDLLKERDGKDSEVYKRAEISRQLFSKILSNRNYQPTKNTAVHLAIGLMLDVNGTQKLLGKAGYALTRSSKADLVVQYYIERGIYSVTFINEALYDCGLPLLKTGLKA